ncbi:MAG: alpha-galactosidase [Bryobacteraceae bacterium]|nr:alpha-galactosidase [Bryobacteraceae bacterium]
MKPTRRDLGRLAAGIFAMSGGAAAQPTRWEFGNGVIRQEVALEQGRYFCRSLLNRGTKREWLHPAIGSDEFLFEFAGADAKPETLTGQGPWKLARHEAGENEFAIELDHASHPLRVRRRYWWNSTLPVVRSQTTVVNRGGETLSIRRLDTFRLRIGPSTEPLELAWMNNYGRGMKPNPGNPIHRRTIGENVRHYVRTGPYSPDCAWFSLAMPGTAEGLAGGWEWSGPMAVAFGDNNDPCLIHGGLDPDGMSEPLAPGGTFTAPAAWYGFYEGDLDDAAELSRRLIREWLAPPLPANDYPWVGYCSWACSLEEDSPYHRGAHPWFPTEENLLSQVDAAAELGCDLFLWDYGWFPKVGDWWCDPARFPNGPRTVTDAIKRRGMKVGLWVGFGNADEDSKVIREHPDWLATYGGAPIPDKFFTRTAASVWRTRTVCLAHKPAREWVKTQLQRVVEDFQLDWLKHDFDLITICQSRGHTHTPGDGRIAACEGFYEIMDFVRARFPSLICENWMNNSATPDYGVVQRHHTQLIGDAYAPFLLRQMVWGHSQMFPLDRQHRYVQFEKSETDFKTQIRSGAVGGPWTILSDPRRMTPEQRRVLAAEIGFFKQRRHLLAAGRLYRLAGRPHPRGWDAFELLDSGRGEGIVWIFRADHEEARRAVRLKGLEPAAVYRAQFRDSGRELRASGRELATGGLALELPARNTSEIVTLTRLP